MQMIPNPAVESLLAAGPFLLSPRHCRADTNHPVCVLSQFLTHRIHVHKTMAERSCKGVFLGMEGVICCVAIETGRGHSGRIWHMKKVEREVGLGLGSGNLGWMSENLEELLFKQRIN